MVLRIVLGTVYSAMAVAQFASMPHMSGILSAYGLMTGGAATGLALTLFYAVLLFRSARSTPAPSAVGRVEVRDRAGFP